MKPNDISPIPEPIPQIENLSPTMYMGLDGREYKRVDELQEADAAWKAEQLREITEGKVNKI